VANLHLSNPGYAVYVERLRRSFGEAALEVGTIKGNNSIAFACKGDLIHRQSIGVIRRPGILDEDAWTQLKPAFLQIASALRRRSDSLHEDA
jgi:spermidine synthase